MPFNLSRTPNILDTWRTNARGGLLLWPPRQRADVMSCIYVLVCPITERVRYVGKTDTHKLELRLQEHIREARRKNLGHRGAWLRSLARQGLSPSIAKDTEIAEGECWREAERRRIAHHRAMGCDLVNGTEGGDGLYKPTAEVRARMRESRRLFLQTEEGKAICVKGGSISGKMNRGKRRTPEQSAKLSEQRKGRRPSAEARAKMSLAQSKRKRHPWNAESRAKMSASRRGHSLSAEHRRKIAAGLLRHYNPEAGITP